MDSSLYKEVTQSIKATFDLTARIDERVKMLSENHKTSSAIMDDLQKRQSDILTKLVLLESKDDKTITTGLQSSLKDIEMRLMLVEKSAINSDNKWKLAFDFTYKTVWVVVVCYILLKLNLQSPPLP